MHVSIAFCTRCWNIKLASCFCGIARIHVFSCVLHVLGQYQTCELPPGQYQTRGLLLEPPEFMSSIMLYMHWGSIRLASCSCRIVSISFVLLRFTGIGAILDQRIPSAASHKFMFVLCVDTHLDSSRLTSCCCGVARIHASIALYTH